MGPPTCRQATQVVQNFNGLQREEGGPFPSIGGAVILYGTSAKGLGGSRCVWGFPGEIPTLFPLLKPDWLDPVIKNSLRTGVPYRPGEPPDHQNSNGNHANPSPMTKVKWIDHSSLDTGPVAPLRSKKPFASNLSSKNTYFHITAPTDPHT